MNNNSNTGQVSSLWNQVEEALDSIRPFLEADGGDVRVVEIVDEHIVRIELLGACGSCPMSTMTLKAGVEEAIKRSVPGISAVEAINIDPEEPKSIRP